MADARTFVGNLNTAEEDAVKGAIQLIIARGVNCLAENDFVGAYEAFDEALGANVILAGELFAYALPGPDECLLQPGRRSSLFFMYWGTALQSLKAERKRQGQQDPHREAHAMYTRAIMLDETNTAAYLLRANNLDCLDMRYTNDRLDDYYVVLKDKNFDIAPDDLKNIYMICSTMRYAQHDNLVAKLTTALAICRIGEVEKTQEALDLFIEIINSYQQQPYINTDYLKTAYYYAGTLCAKLGRTDEAAIYLTSDPISAAPSAAAAAASFTSQTDEETGAHAGAAMLANTAERLTQSSHSAYATAKSVLSYLFPPPAEPQVEMLPLNTTEANNLDIEAADCADEMQRIDLRR